MMEPILEDVANRLESEAKVAKVDTDKASHMFNVIINSPKIPDMVVNNLKYENYKSNWPGLYLYSKKNLDTVNYFKTYGWE